MDYFPFKATHLITFKLQVEGGQNGMESEVNC